MLKNLSTLNKVELRDIWSHEAIDFTRWLASAENLKSLGDAIGIDIKLIRTEASVGKFNVDILAEDGSSDRKIIIENQLEETNHDHLGKIITYASGYDAEIIIWIVKDVREEHQNAIDWLNEHTDENINFFLIKIELWQIDNSNPAPKFEIVVSPNEWAKAIKINSSNGELSSTRLAQLDFWTKFKKYVSEIDTHLVLQTPRPRFYTDISLGYSGAHIGLVINTRTSSISSELYISSDKNLYLYLLDKKYEIEKEIGANLEWEDLARASRIKLLHQVDDIFSQDNIETHFKWMYEKVILFKKVFGKYLAEYGSNK